MKNIFIILVLLVVCVLLFVATSNGHSGSSPDTSHASSPSNVDPSTSSGSSSALTSSMVSDIPSSLSDPESVSKAEPKFIPPTVELTPQVELSVEEHLAMLISCNAVFQSWETTEQMSPDAVVSYYISLSARDERLPRTTVYTPKHPKFGSILLYSQYIEQVGALYFGVSPDMLRKSSYYYEAEDCYTLWGLGSIVSDIVTKVDIVDNETIIYFDMYRDATPENSGALTIQNNTDGSWQYKSFQLLEFGTLTPAEQ